MGALGSQKRITDFRRVCEFAPPFFLSAGLFDFH
jgi:hypothetical protein